MPCSMTAWYSLTFLRAARIAARISNDRHLRRSQRPRKRFRTRQSALNIPQASRTGWTLPPFF